MQQPIIIIATPHPRNRHLASDVRKGLPDYKIIHIKSRNELTVEIIEKYKPDFIFFPHWSWKIPEEIYARYNCVIFHMTDLPYGRGGSPLQNLIIRGHQNTMMSALKCNAEMDAGPVYLKEPLSLDGSAEDILLRASILIKEIIIQIVREKIEPQPQYGKVVEFKRRTHEDGNLAKLTELNQVYDFIRMLDGEGYPPAFLRNGSLMYEFTQVKKTNETVEAKVIIRAKEHE